MEMSPSLSEVNCERISFVSLTPEFASPSVTTIAITGRFGSRGNVSTERIVAKTSVRPCAANDVSHLSPLAKLSAVHSCHERNAYEKRSRNATRLKRSPVFVQVRKICLAALRQDASRSYPI